MEENEKISEKAEKSKKEVVFKLVKDQYATFKEIYEKEELPGIQKHLQGLFKTQMEVVQSYCKENFGVESVADAKKALKKAKKKVKSKMKETFKMAKKDEPIVNLPKSELNDHYKKEA